MKNYFLISTFFPCAAKSPSSPLISLPCGECARKIGQRQFRVPVQPGNSGWVLVDERGIAFLQIQEEMVRDTGFEPVTPTVSR
jgi:phosphoribosyl 1,2-cyclic phosphodiesterase